jgi:hypothetical protein
MGEELRLLFQRLRRMSSEAEWTESMRAELSFNRNGGKTEHVSSLEMAGNAQVDTRGLSRLKITLRK